MLDGEGAGLMRQVLPETSLKSIICLAIVEDTCVLKMTMKDDGMCW